jgi:hypothetical protein
MNIHRNSVIVRAKRELRISFHLLTVISRMIQRFILHLFAVSQKEFVLIGWWHQLFFYTSSRAYLLQGSLAQCLVLEDAELILLSIQ